MPFAHQRVHVDATRRSVTLNPAKAGAVHTDCLLGPGVGSCQKPRFMRPRRASEDTSDAEEKLFVPIQARISEKVSDQNPSWAAPDSGFVDVPLTPDSDAPSQQQTSALPDKRSLEFRLQRTLPTPHMLGPRSRSLDMDHKAVKGSAGPEGSDGRAHQRSRSASIVDSLLFEIYDKLNFGRRFSGESDSFTESPDVSEGRVRWGSGGCGTGPAEGCDKPQGTSSGSGRRFKKSNLENKGRTELQYVLRQYRNNVNYVANDLVRQLKRRDRFLTKRDRSYDIITAILQASSLKRSVDTRMRFSVEPFPGDSGFAQWHDAMRMVARLPGGIPWEFRKRLWLTMAEKHIQHRKVDWNRVKRFCFNDRSNPDDNELGVQIVKDLHRTGCSLFCGDDAEHNQALLKRVLLAYARWNKTVGYCQGFNMLAALILEVMEWKEEDALKVMIYLIEGVLPESYFANNLSGLSVDMAVFRDLLRMRLPGLSRHLDHLQLEARDSASGTSYEPPLTNVFTMQWFLTLFSNCLPKATVLRVWDLIFLEGNEVLLRTALTIWDGLADRIMAVNSADEFYSIMGVLTREMLEFGLMDANHLVKTVCTMAPFPFPQLPELRDKYRYNITPFTAAAAAMGVAKRGLRLFYSDDEDDNEEDALAVAAWCFSSVFPPQLSPIKNKDVLGPRTPSPSSSNTNFSSIGPGAFGATNLHFLDPVRQPGDAERMSLDISALKKQYAKLRERQKQAHIILTAANTNQLKKTGAKPSAVAMNHLLLGKKPLVAKKGKGHSNMQCSASAPLKFQFKPTQSSTNNGNKMTNCKRESNLTKVSITRSEMNISKEVKTVSSGGTSYNKDRKNSLPTPDSGQTLYWRDARRLHSEHAPKMDKTNEDELNEDDTSSTSTELCDEDAGKLSDLGSDIEGEDNSRDSSTATASTERQSYILVRRTTLDTFTKSTDDSSDGDAASSILTNTPSTTTAPESIPSVVVSPGEWVREDWPDWSRVSVDKEDGPDDDHKGNSSAPTQCQDTKSTNAANRSTLPEWLESCHVSLQNDVFADSVDGASESYDQKAATSRSSSWAQRDSKEEDDEDDYSEEKRQEWLAKLEMYRRTLGTDSFDSNSNISKPDDVRGTDDGFSTLASDRASRVSQTEDVGEFQQKFHYPSSSDEFQQKFHYPSSDEFHSLPSDHTPWEDDEEEAPTKGKGQRPRRPGGGDPANGQNRSDLTSDEDENWYACLGDNYPKPVESSTDSKFSLENFLQRHPHAANSLSNFEKPSEESLDGGDDGVLEQNIKTSVSCEIPWRSASRASGQCSPPTDGPCRLNDDSPDQTFAKFKMAGATSSPSILSDVYAQGDEESPGSSPSATRVSKGPVFNPFPVARKSQLWGSSPVGIKLGLYDASRSGSTAKTVGKKQGQK